jgi:hypothetical protein
MDGGHHRFQVFQCQIKLIGICLLGLAPEGCLLEGGHQLLKSFDPLVLAGDMLVLTGYLGVLSGYRGVFARLACLCCNQHRLQGGNIIGKISGIQHGRNIPNAAPICLRNLPS